MGFRDNRVMTEAYEYPFSAITGQEEMKLALILNAIEPRIGGLLIRGEKGTAKSTAVRALRDLLPEIAAVRGCPCHCDPDGGGPLCSGCAETAERGGRLRNSVLKVPLVELPLNATEEMITGSLDVEHALREGKRRFRPGLLARANRGILYMDEVNLLDDHIVDIILDAAASGVNLVEREGLSCVHPSRFILVGTMNPEEGALRPQLLDRFGLCVETRGEAGMEGRVRLMEMRESYDSDPAGFRARCLSEDRRIADRIVQARKRLAEVVFPRNLLGLVSEICIGNNVAGHRADIVIRHAARALAAYEGRHGVTAGDIDRVADMALLHRRRDALPPPPGADTTGNHDDAGDRDDQGRREAGGPAGSDDTGQGRDDPGGWEYGDNRRQSPEQPPQEDDFRSGADEVFEPGPAFRVQALTQEKDRLVRRGPGRRSRTRTAQKTGRYVKSIRSDRYPDIAVDATIRAAAPHQRVRKKAPGMALSIQSDDIRRKVREKRVGNFLVFIVDGSGSMGARARMVATKGAILSLLLDAYQKRDRVAMVTFRQQGAVVCLPPTPSVELAVRYLGEMPVGGRTPLSAGLLRGYELLRTHLLKEPSSRPIAIIVTDGRANVSADRGLSPQDEVVRVAAEMSREKRVRYIVIDTEEEGVVRFGLAGRLAAALGAERFSFNSLKAGDIVDIVRRRI